MNDDNLLADLEETDELEAFSEPKDKQQQAYTSKLRSRHQLICPSAS